MTPDTTTTEAPPLARPWRRRLRVAWTVFFGVLTVALSVLWVRSYWWSDAIFDHCTAISATFTSEAGECQFVVGGNRTTRRGIEVNQLQLRDKRGIRTLSFNSEWHGLIGFDAYWHNSTEWGLFFPHWILGAVTASIAAFPWLPFRFSLRTMLIATTLIAVVLGLIMWSTKQ